MSKESTKNPDKFLTNIIESFLPFENHEVNEKRKEFCITDRRIRDITPIFKKTSYEKNSGFNDPIIDPLNVKLDNRFNEIEPENYNPISYRQENDSEPSYHQEKLNSFKITYLEDNNKKPSCWNFLAKICRNKRKKITPLAQTPNIEASVVSFKPQTAQPKLAKNINNQSEILSTSFEAVQPKLTKIANSQLYHFHPIKQYTSNTHS